MELAATQSPFGTRTRVATSFAGTPPRYVRPPSHGDGSWCEVSSLITTDKAASRGTDDTAFGFHAKESASSPPGPSKNLLRFLFSSSAGDRKQKPLRSIGSGGVRSLELVEQPQAIPPPRESMRAPRRRSH
jgi:hypothetical protein